MKRMSIFIVNWAPLSLYPFQVHHENLVIFLHVSQGRLAAVPLRQGLQLGLASPPQLVPKKNNKSPLQGQRKMKSTENPIEWQPHLIFIVTADTM